MIKNTGRELYREIKSLIKQSESVKMLVIYRWISLAITSIFFLLYGLNEYFLGRKIFIIGCISLSSIILNYLYVENEGLDGNIKLLIITETIGNSLILIPSGGLNSPYVWYAINTILIASIRLGPGYCWVNLFVYLFNSTYISRFIWEDRGSFTRVLAGESNLILSFILITAIIQILSKHLKGIEEKNLKLLDLNNQLTLANKMVQDNMDYLMELYQTVGIFSAQENLNEFVELILNYSRRILKGNTFIYLHPLIKKTQETIKLKNGCMELDEEMLDEISKNWDMIVNSEGPIKISVDGRGLFLTCIRCNYKVYGVLGTDIAEKNDGSHDIHIMEQLKFLGSLSAMTLKKFELDQVNEELLINQEKNRIANEIHDGILQKLFGISCSIFEAIRQLDADGSSKIGAELNMVRGCINNVMKDLRTTIYGLSWKKDGINNFIVNIDNYISEIEMLNNIKIDFNIEGNHELLSIMHKKAIYRIICESVGNAVRHGRSKYVRVRLSIDANIISLEIIDRGIGFEFPEMDKDGLRGMGIRNIHQLVNSLNGVIDFKSRLGQGTLINIMIPNGMRKMCKEEAL